MPPEICPACGAVVPPNAKACPECGSDEQTGWSDQARADDLGLPDENFDYDEFVKRVFGGEESRPRGIKPLWWIVAVLILLAVAAFILMGALR
jgi:predicted nucleic acid-binding Zn ribbon protein